MVQKEVRRHSAVSRSQNNMSKLFTEPRSAYIHVPFCAHRCGYCDFTLVARRDDLIDDYLRAIERELSTLGTKRTLETLYFGGGTPTHLGAAQLQRLMSVVFSWFELDEGYEFSVEANPFGLDDEKIEVLVSAGVNRISLGVQSFDAPTLELLERDHRRIDVIDTIRRLKSCIGNISFDLIFGVPGQTASLWQQTLRHAVELDPQHVSTYGLTYEKGTSYWIRRERGNLIPIAEELDRQMYSAAMDELTRAGFTQYEISSFARPGYRCRHNEVYWKGLPYYGFGPGAARYLNGRRETNHRSVTTWLKRSLQGESPVAECEQLSDEDRARESLVLGLRRIEGIQRDEFESQTGYRVDDLAGDVIHNQCEAGLLEDVGSHLRLTREGRFLADSVVVALL